MERKYEVKNIIALCHILDSFEEFEKRLLSVISPKYNRDFVSQLFEISYLRKNKIGAIKAKKFYEENKGIIDEINKYSNISRFINDNYDYYGKSNGNLEYIYKYIMSHKQEIDKMLEILLKLNKLGFDHFNINEQLDFTQKVYGVESIFNYNYRIFYVANPEIIPSYDSSINYKTKDSNYEMELEVSSGTNGLNNYCKKITLNSLLFDINTLPKKVDRANIYDVLDALKEKQKQQSKKLQNAVDLSIGVIDLEREIINIDKIIAGLETVTNKEKLLKVLLEIKENIAKLKELSEEQNISMTEQEHELTLELIENEKKRILAKRFWDSVDLC